MLRQKSIFFLLTLLAGCAAPLPPVVPVRDPAAVALDDAINSSAVNRKVGPETKAPDPVYGAKTSVSFLGDAAVLLKNAATGSGPDWKFEQSGPAPHLPIYVQVNVKDVAFTDFLRNVAEQLGQRADIELGAKRITLRYRANQ
jgi:hypothetical protein